MSHAHDPRAFPTLVVTWQTMMVAMMAPAVWPWVAAYARFIAAPAPPARRAALTVVFASGYFTAWLAYSLAAAAAQLVAIRSTAALGASVTAILLAGAGLYQLAPLKRACLVHCRNPLTYFLRQWRSGASAAFSLGFGHGVYCVGCCWALMATMVAVGGTSVAWMLALAAVAFVEQVVPGGDKLRVPLGAALVMAAVVGV